MLSTNFIVGTNSYLSIVPGPNRSNPEIRPSFIFISSQICPQQYDPFQGSKNSFHHYEEFDQSLFRTLFWRLVVFRSESRLLFLFLSFHTASCTFSILCTGNIDCGFVLYSPRNRLSAISSTCDETVFCYSRIYSAFLSSLFHQSPLESIVPTDEQCFYQNDFTPAVVLTVCNMVVSFARRR